MAYFLYHIVASFAACFLQELGVKLGSIIRRPLFEQMVQFLSEKT
jgi:hypothetical protein